MQENEIQANIVGHFAFDGFKKNQTTGSEKEEGKQPTVLFKLKATSLICNPSYLNAAHRSTTANIDLGATSCYKTTLIKCSSKNV